MLALALLVSLAALTPPAPPAPLRVLVLSPTSDQVDKGVLQSITSMISVELAKQKQLDVVSSDEVRKLAELEADKQSAGCSDSSCLAELAGAMGARLVLFGDAAMLGTVVVLNLNVFDSTEARSVGRASLNVRGLEEVPEKLPATVQELVGPILEKQAQLAREAAGDTAPPAPAPSEPLPMGAVAGWTMVGGGALVALGTLGYDAVAGSSANGTFDLLDLVGPIGAVAGAALVAGGVYLALSAAPAEPQTEVIAGATAGGADAR